MRHPVCSDESAPEGNIEAREVVVPCASQDAAPIIPVTQSQHVPSFTGIAGMTAIISTSVKKARRFRASKRL